MNVNNETHITKDVAKKQLVVVREFNAPLEQVWDAWTKKELLDEWWAPSPWKAKTKSMDFREGGVWLYAMQGPEGEENWSRADFQSIVTQKSYEGDDAFCDAEGNINNQIPGMHWKVEFSPSAAGTVVRVEITIATEKDLNTIVEMGFKEGFTAAHGNLDELLSRRKSLNSQGTA